MGSVDVDALKKILHNWASKLPHRCRIYYFGSRLKETARADSDLDVAVEFLDYPDAWMLWFDVHKPWELQLTDLTGLKVHLELFEGNESPHVKQALDEASVVLYEPEKP